MKIRLIENGLDSLKKGFQSLRKYEEMYFVEKSGEERYFVLKDAILAVHHGIEILFKTVLFNTHEILIFSEIDKPLKNAYVERRQKKLTSLFETDQTLHTVTFREAVDRVQRICGFDLTVTFSNKIEALEAYRNNVTHSEVTLDELKVNNTFDGLVDEVDLFFLDALGDSYSTVTGYSSLRRDYDAYIQILDEKRQYIKKEAVKTVMEALEKCSISIGENECRSITDINKAGKLVEILYKSDLRFGSDLYNGYCSGEVSEFKRISEGRFSLFAKDNKAKYIFKFKSLLLYMPKIDGDFSPIVFFEADSDTDIDGNIRWVENDVNDRKSISGLYFTAEKKLEWNPMKIHEFYARMEYDEYFVIPGHYLVEHFISPGVFCYINFQGLKFWPMRAIIDKCGNAPLKEIGLMLQSSIESTGGNL